MVHIYLSQSLAAHSDQRRAEGGKRPLHLGTSDQFLAANILATNIIGVTMIMKKIKAMTLRSTMVMMMLIRQMNEWGDKKRYN